MKKIILCMVFCFLSFGSSWAERIYLSTDSLNYELICVDSTNGVSACPDSFHAAVLFSGSSSPVYTARSTTVPAWILVIPYAGSDDSKDHWVFRDLVSNIDGAGTAGNYSINVRLWKDNVPTDNRFYFTESAYTYETMVGYILATRDTAHIANTSALIANATATTANTSALAARDTAHLANVSALTVNADLIAFRDSIQNAITNANKANFKANVSNLDVTVSSRFTQAGGDSVKVEVVNIDSWNPANGIMAWLRGDTLHTLAYNLNWTWTTIWDSLFDASIDTLAFVDTVIYTKNAGTASIPDSLFAKLDSLIHTLGYDNDSTVLAFLRYIRNNQNDYKATGFAVAGDAMALTPAERGHIEDSIYANRADYGGVGTTDTTAILALNANHLWGFNTYKDSLFQPSSGDSVRAYLAPGDSTVLAEVSAGTTDTTSIFAMMNNHDFAVAGDAMTLVDSAITRAKFKNFCFDSLAVTPSIKFMNFGINWNDITNPTTTQGMNGTVIGEATNVAGFSPSSLDSGVCTDDFKKMIAIRSDSGIAEANVLSISGDTVAADNFETMLDGTGGKKLTLGGLHIRASNRDTAFIAWGDSGYGIFATSNEEDGVKFHTFAPTYSCFRVGSDSPLTNGLTIDAPICGLTIGAADSFSVYIDGVGSYSNIYLAGIGRIQGKIDRTTYVDSVETLITSTTSTSTCDFGDTLHHIDSILMAGITATVDLGDTLHHIDSILTAGVSATCVGVGSNAVIIRIMDISDSTGIAGFGIVAKDSTSGAQYASGTTTSAGVCTLGLGTTTYRLFFESMPWTITSPVYARITGNTTLTYYATAISPSAPPADTLCVVYGYVKHSDGTPYVGARAEMFMDVAPVWYHGTLLDVQTPKVVYSDANGKYEFSTGIYPNDVLTPAGTTWIIRVKTSVWLLNQRFELPIGASYKIDDAIDIQ